MLYLPFKMSDDTSSFPSEIADLDGTKKNSKKLGEAIIWSLEFFLKGPEVKNNKAITVLNATTAWNILKLSR